MSEKKKIFIADDDETVLTSLKRLLVLAGFEVETAQRAKEVTSRIKGFKPDLIILDLLMPNLGGLEICEMLNQDKETQNIPIIVVSGLAGIEDIKKAYRLGVINYFTKPYDFDKLLKEINKAIIYKEKKI
ncbi:MAG: response regulator [Candidatus Omnitrophica bacterium]|nr:response regulator [Candidatus Omnitrophota bacterium]